MIWLILQVSLLTAGVTALATGQFKVTSNRSVRGWPARLAGGLLMLPLPLSFAAGFFMGLTGRVDNSNFQMSMLKVEVGILLGCILLATCLAIAFCRRDNLEKADANA